MKVAIILCMFFALTLAAVRPLLVDSDEFDEKDRPLLVDSDEFDEKVEIRPNRLEVPSESGRVESDRIVGGSNAGRGIYKYQISLQLYTSSRTWAHTCGGSIIGLKRILTAAHCVDTYPLGQYSYRVVAGEYELERYEGSEQNLSPSSFSIHPAWDRSRLNNDVAVIRLSKAITKSSFANIVTLATTNPNSGVKSIVTGWGYTNYYTQNAPKIMQVLHTVRRSDTEAKRDYYNYDSSAQIATYDSNQGICSGDSGGPLVKSGSLEQYGVCSYVLTPCGSNKSDYYARVTTFRSWILSQ